MDNFVSIRHRNIQTFATEMCKFANGMSPEITNEIFQLREINHCNVRHSSLFIAPSVNKAYNGTESAAKN